MKNQGIIAITAANKSTNIQQNHSPRLSDDAFYLIALAILLKKIIRPATLNEFLTPGNFVAFNDDVIG